MMPENAGIDALSAQLSSDVARWTEKQNTEQISTAIEGLTFYRRETTTDCAACLVEPSVALVVQGAKSMSLGTETFRYDPHRFLITSLDLPATMQILEASQERPYLGLALKLDLRMVGELMLQAPNTAAVESAKGRSMMLGNITPAILDAFQRMVSLLDEPASISVLAPLIKREIYWRVLMSEQGVRLKQIVSVGSQSHRIARAIEWLKTHYDQALRVEKLADLAQMSQSTFHHHFRQLTAMSPLQYQKWLRLTEARRLMLGEDLDAAKAAYLVGYESPSQFSREYGRLFGVSPKRDIDALKRQSSNIGREAQGNALTLAVR